SRWSGIVSGPGSLSNSGYCGNIGSGRLMPFGVGTTGRPDGEFISRLWMETSMRNLVGAGVAILRPPLLDLEVSLVRIEMRAIAALVCARVPVPTLRRPRLPSPRKG